MPQGYAITKIWVRLNTAWLFALIRLYDQDQADVADSAFDIIGCLFTVFPNLCYSSKQTRYLGAFAKIN